MELIRADAGWKKEILRFADEVFGTDLPPGGFARLKTKMPGLLAGRFQFVLEYSLKP